MYRLSMLLCTVSAVVGIIVRDPPPSPNDYKYSYNIEDPTTGDTKSQHEVRQGDMVSGAYTVLGADGTKRTVEYTADAKHGFRAVVSEEPATNSQIAYQTVPKPFNIPVRPLPYFPKDSNPSDRVKGIFYFTPANEIKPDGVSFNQGQYFIPA